MKNWLLTTVAVLAIMTGAAAQAHEFWMTPSRYVVEPAGSAQLKLGVGENLRGDQVGFSAALVAAMRQYAGGQSADLRSRVPAQGQIGELAVTLPRPGTHLVVLDTHATQLVLPADKFHAYLHEEGLDFVIRQREAAGTAATPGRERFRRNLKTLLQAGDTPDATHAVRTGQRLDIVALANPYEAPAPREIGFQVLFDGRPLAGALLKAWHRRGEQTLVIRTTTDAQGRVGVSLPWGGAWMVSVVHMVPATDSPEVDWDSYWGNLTFAVPQPPR